MRTEETEKPLLRELERSGLLPFPVQPRRIVRDAVREDESLERHLVLHESVPRADLLRAVIELKGTHAIHVDGDWVESGIADSISRGEAHALRIVPLARWRDRLYVLRGKGVHPQKVGRSSKLVVVGETADVHTHIDRLYDVLDEYATGYRRFGEFLVQQGVVNEADLEAALVDQHERGGHLGQVLARRAAATESAIWESLAAFTHQPFFQTRGLLERLQPPIAIRIPRHYAERHQVVAIGLESGEITIATSNPSDLESLDAVAKTFQASRRRVLVTTPSSLADLITSIYGEAELDVERRAAEEAALGPVPEAPAYVTWLLAEAVHRKASDVHLMRFEDGVEVGFRVDGVLLPAPSSPIHLSVLPSVVAVIKIEAGLDITERRRPQDGVIRRRIAGTSVDFRVAVQPTIWGENVSIRVLDKAAVLPSLDLIGLEPAPLAQLRRILEGPQGLILVAGPTGSGKTTTLYAMVDVLLRAGRRIVTAEDPVEYAVPGVQQSQVSEEIGNTFDRYLRAFLRQDPDVILVGEIRDSATAQMAVRAALTGRLVLSTLHVSDALSTVRRLTDLGVEPNLLSQTLQCVVAQRLVRRVCSHCSEPSQPAAEIVTEIFGATVPMAFVRGRGCPACHHTGHSGRVALLEFWEPDDPMRRLIDRGADAGELQRQARCAGMIPLIEHGRILVRRGVTTVEELRAKVPYDQIVRYPPAM